MFKTKITWRGEMGKDIEESVSSLRWALLHKECVMCSFQRFSEYTSRYVWEEDSLSSMDGGGLKKR